ncbi:URA2 [Symbiodinium microadriaticum]|nr:URA2 [Symbiodinium microadriaticum]
MTLASELLKDATEARKTWIRRQTERFAKACQQRLRDSQGFETTTTLKIFAPATTERGAKEAAKELKRSLEEQGFLASEVQVVPVAKGVTPRLSVQASLLKDEMEDRAGGLQGHCPVCLGSKVLVALAPCGHTVCKDCKRTVCPDFIPARLLHRNKCPVCRSVVDRATAGIFVS